MLCDPFSVTQAFYATMNTNNRDRWLPASDGNQALLNLYLEVNLRLHEAVFNVSYEGPTKHYPGLPGNHKITARDTLLNK